MKLAKRILTYIAWAVAVCACAVAFVMTGNALALWVAAIALAVPPLGFVVALLGAGGVSLELEGSTSASKGSDVVCTLVARNGSNLPMPRLVVEVEVENLLTLQKCVATPVVCAGPRSEVRVPIHISSSTCGRVECRIANCRVEEPMGILGRRVQQGATRRLSIMPDLQDAYLRNVLSAAPLSDTVTYSPDRKGSDLSEVRALRQYEPGDEIRRIHWKLSSKMDEYIVKEPSLPLDNSILVFWDKTLYGVDADPLRADAMAEVVLAICERLVHEGIQFNVASNNVIEGRCTREYITDEGDIYELIGHLMSSPLGVGESGGLDQYMLMYGGVNCSRLIYVSTGLPPAACDLGGEIDVIAFVCDDGDSLEIDGRFAKIHFKSGAASTALALAEVV